MSSSVFEGVYRLVIFVALAAMMELRILIQARITEPLEKEIYVKKNASFRLICEEIDNVTAPMSFAGQSSQARLKWLKMVRDSDRFQADVRPLYQITERTHGKEISSLIAEPGSLSDDAVYRCQSDAAPSDTVSVKVVEFFCKNGIVEKLHEDALLTCLVHDSHSNRMNITWLRAGQRIENKAKKYTIDVDNGTLTVHRVGEKDIGNYSCVMLTRTGRNVTTEVQLLAYPFVKNFEKSQNIREGSETTLHCHAGGSPPPSITWYKNGILINVSDGGADQRLFFDNDTAVPHSQLTLRSARFEDRAVYTCVASSSKWPSVSSSSSILVRVKGRLAALWPFLGLCVEVIILLIIIFFYEKNRKSKKEEEEANCDGGKHLTNCNASSSASSSDNVRHRK